MKRFFCDVCGKEISKGIDIIQISYIKDKRWVNKKIELDPGCREKIEKYIDNLKV